MSNTNSKVAGVAGGKFLTFALGKEEYGLEILKVREIIGHMEITPVPRTPAYVKGVTNLRGQVIPIIDLRAKFGMPSIEKSQQNCVIVVETQHTERKLCTGIVVDRVCEVQYIAADQIEPPPAFDSSVNIQFILGMGKVGNSLKILIDIDQVVTASELKQVSELALAA